MNRLINILISVEKEAQVQSMAKSSPQINFRLSDNFFLSADSDRDDHFLIQLQIKKLYNDDEVHEMYDYFYG
jgi:hypothetical protein